MQKAILNLEPLSCPSCSQKIANAVKGLDGVDQNSVKVLFNASKITQLSQLKIGKYTLI